MKINNPIIIATTLTFIMLNSVRSISSNVTDSRPKTPYQWGSLKKFHQILSDQTGEAYYNQTKEFKFNFEGYRTTYNMKIEKYQGEGPNPCQIQQRSVDMEFDRIDTDLNLPIHTYVSMHSFNNYLVALTHGFKILIFRISQKQDEGISLSVMNIIQIPTTHSDSFDIQIQNSIITSSYNGKLVHLIFPHMMITFQMPEDDTKKDAEIQLFHNQKYKNYKNVKAAKFVKGHLFISVGEEGIEIYKIENQASVVYEHVGNINKTELDLKDSLNAQDLALDYSSRLYIVCNNNGVIIYQVDEKLFSNSRKLHLIGMLKNSNQIAVRGDHTLVVTGEEQIHYIQYIYQTQLYKLLQQQWVILYQRGIL